MLIAASLLVASGSASLAAAAEQNPIIHTAYVFPLYTLQGAETVEDGNVSETMYVFITGNSSQVDKADVAENIRLYSMRMGMISFATCTQDSLMDQIVLSYDMRISSGQLVADPQAQINWHDGYFVTIKDGTPYVGIINPNTMQQLASQKDSVNTCWVDCLAHGMSVQLDEDGNCEKISTNAARIIALEKYLGGEQASVTDDPEAYVTQQVSDKAPQLIPEEAVESGTTSDIMDLFMVPMSYSSLPQIVRVA